MIKIKQKKIIFMVFLSLFYLISLSSEGKSLNALYVPSDSLWEDLQQRYYSTRYTYLNSLNKDYDSDLMRQSYLFPLLIPNNPSTAFSEYHLFNSGGAYSTPSIDTSYHVFFDFSTIISEYSNATSNRLFDSYPTGYGYKNPSVFITRIDFGCMYSTTSILQDYYVLISVVFTVVNYIPKIGVQFYFENKSTNYLVHSDYCQYPITKSTIFYQNLDCYYNGTKYEGYNAVDINFQSFILNSNKMNSSSTYAKKDFATFYCVNFINTDSSKSVRTAQTNIIATNWGVNSLTGTWCNTCFESIYIYLVQIVPNNGNQLYNSMKFTRFICYNESYNEPIFRPFDFGLLTSDNYVFISDDYIDYSEPNATNYWEYTSYNIQEEQTSTIIIENINYTFTFISGIETTARFYYNDEMINCSDWGNWSINIFGYYNVDFNWVRNAIVNALNTIIYFFQFMFYLIFASASFILTYLVFVFVVPFIWNVLIYYIIYAIVFVLYWVIQGIFLFFEWLFNAISTLWNDVIFPAIMYIWDSVIYPALLWIWDNVVIPVYDTFVSVLTYLYETVLPLIVDFLFNTLIPTMIGIVVVVLSFLEAIILWCFSLGSQDFDSIFNSVVSFNTVISEFFINLTTVLINNLAYFLLYTAMYLVLIGFVFLKLLYCKAKGYSMRVWDLENSLEAYMYPIKTAYSLIINMKNLIAGWL